ncbi:peptidase [Streptococcus pseudopneumoniae]|uniref:Peptidase n=1 Tax=Streptococcus pseudopneumoniae TaxID=257758 RepID=A0A3A4MHT3_9STRE|nr:ZmpA/ZmpB/ZmpC family metallo-endopeptidase [Streptococcus pseudopneumoniae]RJP07429.1 peptidase [Streptococcus pseudopneumoniae]
MEKYFGEKQERFSFRKLSVGLVSATISSLFFMSVLASSSVDAQETKGVHYKYVTDSELSSEEKNQLVYDIPTYVENDDETYYLVYKLNSQNQLGELPNTGSKNEMQALVAGASLTALGILIFAVSKKKVKNKTVLHLVLVAGIGNGVLISAHALENHLLLNYNTDYELTSGEKLPLPKEISGYTYIGYIKEGKTTSDSEVSNQKSSVATPTKQQKVDYNVTPNFVENPKVQDIQEQTPVSSTKPTEVQVVEKPLSTELTDPTKEEKQSSNSQSQLAEHKNLETKKEEKNSPKEKTGVNTLNPQDEVLSGQLNKPELLYRDETIETKIDFQEEVQENPDLAEGTVRVKQEGTLGKKVEVIRIFSVNKKEVSREIVSTSTTAPVSRIVEKGTKKTQVITEQPETGVEHKDVQAGAIVEPAVQPALPEAVVTDKGKPEVQPELPEAVVSDKGVPEVQPALPEAVVTDKGESEVQPELPEAVVSDKGVPEVQPELPEAVVTDKGKPEVQPALPEATSENTPAPSKPETPASTEAAANGAEGTDSTSEAGGKETEEPATTGTETPTPVTDNSPSDTGTTDQPVASNPSSEASALSTEDSATGDTPAPETLTNTEEYGKQSVEPSHSGAESATEVTGETSGTTSEDEGKEAKEANEQSGASTEPSTVSEGGSPATQPAGEEDKSESTSETSTTPPVDATNDSGNSEPSPSVIEGNKEETNSQNTEASTEKGNSESSNSDSEKPQGDEPTVQVGSEPTASTEGTSTGKEDSAPKAEEKQVDKKLELRNISNVELFTVENNKYRHVTSFDAVPNDPSNYFMKVKSEKFKDVMLPVKSIENVRKDNQDVYKIVGQANDLIQHENNSTLENYTYYLPKVIKSENGVYTSFKNLVDAMNNDPRGTFRLGATMDAREVELSEGQESYVNKDFSGKLIGINKNKHYAIYNLKKPLFNTLSNATIQDLSIKEANVSSKEDAATIAKEAKYNTRIDNVHSDGVISGERGIGGLVSKVDNSRISNSSFTGRITNTYDTTAGYEIGGLVGKLSGSLASIEKSIASIDIASNAKSGDQIVGGIAGVVDKKATISNSYVEGNLNNVKHFGYVGGVAGYLWDRDSSEVSNSGNLTNVLSDVNVTNGNAIAGYDFNGIKTTNTYSNKNNKVVNVVQVDDELVTKDSDVQRGTVLETDKVKEKKVELVSKYSTKVEDFDFTSRYNTNYNEVTGYQQSREQVYKNIEKLLPFYNRETIVKYGNLVDESSELFTKELLSVVPMKDNEVITDINKNKQEINKLLLHFEGNKSQVLNIAYKNDFSKVAEYNIEGQGLLYTPNTLLHDYSNIINNVLNDLKSVQYDSGAVRKVLDISGDIKLTELYLDEQFDKTKEAIGDSLAKLLSADAAIAENSNSIIDNYVIEKIKKNKEALLLGLTYLERWYNFKYDNASAKDLVLYHLDFFGKSNSSALDNVIELGKSGFNNLLAKNNVITYNVLLSKNYGTETLFKALEEYRKVFLPTTSNNDWFKTQSKAYIVEEKSTIPEVSSKQSEQGTEHSIGVYDRLTSPSWKYQSMVLPLLTLPEEKMIFMIANISTIGFGAYDRYRSPEHPKGEKLNKFVEDNAQAAAKRFRDHYDYWYKILDKENKEKLYRSVLVYDAFRFGNDKDNKLQEANFETNHPAIKNFFGPAGNNVVHNANGAYATGDAFYYMAYRMLDKSGAVTYTHEMTHNSDREIYLGGYGRRSGLGPEFFAKGLLQAPDHPEDATITINSILKHSKSDSTEGQRLQVLDPTTRFKNSDDLKQYVHNMFDVVYMLEYLEGQSIVKKLNVYQKMEALRKIENKYVKDPADGNEVYATNVVKTLTEEEAQQLTNFDSLINHNILSAREYKSKEYERNGYFTIKLFAPIYAALSSDIGTPGDLMGRRMAYELLAAKGFKDGMVPYISNQYEDLAKQNGKKITIYGKERGLVTDKLVLEKLFDSKYPSWAAFKKAMYQERIAQFNHLTKVTFKDPTQSWMSNATKTIQRVNDLQQLMDEAVLQDAEERNYYYWNNYNPETDSAVHKLKKAIFKAYLDQTNDFRSSIFGNKK